MLHVAPLSMNKLSTDVLLLCTKGIPLEKNKNLYYLTIYYFILFYLFIFQMMPPKENRKKALLAV